MYNERNPLTFFQKYYKNLYNYNFIKLITFYFILFQNEKVMGSYEIVQSLSQPIFIAYVVSYFFYSSWTYTLHFTRILRYRRSCLIFFSFPTRSERGKLKCCNKKAIIIESGDNSWKRSHECYK